MGLKPRLQKNNPNKEIQIRKSDPLRGKNAKCHNDCYVYKRKQCLELHDRLRYSQEGKERVEEMKEINYKAIFKKREHIF